MAISRQERERRAREARLRQQVARTLSPARRSVAPTGKISRSGNVGKTTKKYANPAIAQLAKSAGETRSQGLFGKLLTNAASDALEIVTGVVPGTIRLGYELGKSGTVDAFRRIKTGEKQGSDRYLGELAKGFKADIEYRWGEPLKKGFTRNEWGLLGERVLEHPLYAVLDVGGVTAVAGKGARVGALASGKLTGSTTLKRIGENSILAPGERLPTVGKRGQVDWDAAQRGRAGDRGGVRYREPKRLTETNPRNKSVRTIEVPRAPYSGNPLVRGLQKGVEPLTGKATRLVRETADEVMAGQRTRVPLPKAAERAVLGWASSERAFNRAQRKQTVRKRNEYEAAAAARQREVTSEYMKAIRSLGGDSDARLAVGLHLRGLLKDSTGKRTPQQLRDNAVATWERNQKREGVDLPTVREQIEAIRNLPDEYLTLRSRQVAEGVPTKGTPAKIEQAVKEGQKLGKRLQNIQVARGVVSRHTADRAGQIPGMVVHGGSEWAPHQAGLLGDARRSSLRKAREIRSKYDAGEAPSTRDQARLDRMMEGRRELRRRQQAIKESAVDRAHPEVVRAQRAVDESRAAQAAQSRNPYPSRADARAQRTIEESLSTHLRELKKAEERHTGHTPAAPGSPFDPDAVYIPTVPLEPRTRGFRRQPGTGLNQQVKQNTGLHIRLGDVNFDPGLLVEQAARVMRSDVGPLSAQAMDELIRTAAYRHRGSDRYIVGNRAMSLVMADENTILMNRRSLEKHLNRERKADDAADFQNADDFERETFFNKDTITDEIKAQVAKDGKAGQNWIAISKPAYDTWMSAYRAPGKVLQTVDTYTSAWKAGLLAFMPRWYVNNVLGLFFQYGIMTGGDLKSLWQATKSPELRRVTPDAFEGATVTRDIAETFAMGSPLKHGPVRRAAQRAYDFNNTIEGFWRRGAYLNRSKRVLKDEGVAVRKLDDADLAKMIDEMPETLRHEALRQAEFFIGDFINLSPFEQNYIRRLIPFYAWWRVAARLTFGMPVKSPGRAEAMALLARAHEITDPLEGMRPAWARGAVEIGGMRIPTRAFSPFATHADMVAGLGNITSGTSAVGETLNYATGWAHPLVGAGLQAGMQRDPFGGEVFSAPLADGIATGFGSNTKWNPVTGTAEDARPSLPWTEIAFKSLVPGYSQVLRSTLAAGESVPETTGTGSLALYRLKQLAGIDDPMERPSVIYEPANKPVSQPWGGSRLEKGIAAGVGALTGIRPQTEDPVELERRYAANTKRHLDNQKAAVRAYMKQLARARSER